MDKKAIPDSLFTELREQGYSDEMIKEIYKWYDSSDYKELQVSNSEVIIEKNNFRICIFSKVI